MYPDPAVSEPSAAEIAILYWRMVDYFFSSVIQTVLFIWYNLQALDQCLLALNENPRSTFLQAQNNMQLWNYIP